MPGNKRISANSAVADSPATFTKLTQPTSLQTRALELADTITIK